jgi:hypothetical protein
MYRLILILLIFLFHLNSNSQSIEGTTGLLKIPSAEMQTDGTFILGANYLPDAITPEPFDYNTENYYFNITFLPFIEFTFRSTVLKWDENTNQDRSFGLRLRLLKESKILPSIVIGGNDLYSSSPGMGSKYYNSLYGVATKQFILKNNRIGFTIGYGNGGVRGENLNGIFGGISFAPAFLPSMRLMVDYDAEVVSAGAEMLFFKNLCLYGMAYDLKYFAGGLAYRIYLKK